MRNFPIMQMKKGDDVTVITDSATRQGLVESWTNDPSEGFAVQVKVFCGDYEWFYVREGATLQRRSTPTRAARRPDVRPLPDHIA